MQEGQSRTKMGGTKNEWNKNWLGPLDFGWWRSPSLIAKRSEQNKNGWNKNEWNKNWLGPLDFGWWEPPPV